MVADAIVENRDIEYPIDEYYKTHCMPQTEQEIKEEKEQKDSDFLQTATEYYYKNIKAARFLEKEEKKNPFIDAVSANEDMVVHDKIIIEDWYVDGKFNDENVKMFEDVKLYIDDLIKKTIENKSVPTESLKQATEPIEQALADKK